MSELTRHEWQELLSGYTTSVLVGNWVVAAAASAGATSFTVVIADTRTASTNGTPPLVGASDAANFVGARIVFGRGVETPLNLTDPQPPSTGLNFGFSTTVSSVVTDFTASPPVTTVTLQDAVPQALAIGDSFTIFRTLAIDVNAPENITEVGGVEVPTDFAGNPAVPITHFDQLVQNGTIGSTQTGFVASGDEVAYLTLTVNGVWRVNGAAYLQSLVVNLGGTVIVGDTGQITTGAF